MPLIYETKHFIVKSRSKPHVSRTDGGHITIMPKDPVENRWDFEPTRAKALMRISMMVGEAMKNALNERGVPVERLNFHDNGNWSINTEAGPKCHLHLYGRARDSVNQTPKEIASRQKQEIISLTLKRSTDKHREILNA